MNKERKRHKRIEIQLQSQITLLFLYLYVRRKQYHQVPFKQLVRVSLGQCLRYDDSERQINGGPLFSETPSARN